MYQISKNFLDFEHDRVGFSSFPSFHKILGKKETLFLKKKEEIIDPYLGPV